MATNQTQATTHPTLWHDLIHDEMTALSARVEQNSQLDFPGLDQILQAAQVAADAAGLAYEEASFGKEKGSVV